LSRVFYCLYARTGGAENDQADPLGTGRGLRHSRVQPR
jgi:hypothetical protein